MDAQYPFASREDIWRVQEELKELYSTQIEQAERINRLERRKEEDARIKSVWEPSFIPTVEPFKGFDQAHHHILANSLHVDTEEEPRRGAASRANSVRFDESSMYYSQANRSAAELAPSRTGSGLGGVPLAERSFSHRSEGKQGSPAQSHHSARTNSLGFDASRLIGSATSGSFPASALTPPPGLFILGHVPGVIRCWLTTNFTNDSLLYAAVCTGAYRSVIAQALVKKLDLEKFVGESEGIMTVRLPVYFPEASIYQSSSRGGSPVAHVPSLSIHFVVRDTDPRDRSIQIILGSDVLRGHNADILFSQDKMLIVDDDHNKLSIPLVRPENDASFKNLSTGPELPLTAVRHEKDVDELDIKLAPTNLIEQGGEMTELVEATVQDKSKLMTLPLRHSSDSFEGGSTDLQHHGGSAYDPGDGGSDYAQSKHAPVDESIDQAAKSDRTGSWTTSWRRESGSGKGQAVPFSSVHLRGPGNRNMKVLKPTKPSLSTPRQFSGMSSRSSGGDSAMSRSGDQGHHSTRPSSSEDGEFIHTQGSNPAKSAGDGSRSDKNRPENPMGGASAFGWLNSSQRR